MSANRGRNTHRRVHGAIRYRAAGARRPAPTEPVPSAFCLDPKGKLLFAAGTASRRLASYRIDSEGGTLTPLGAWDVGPRPAAIAAVRLDQASH
jgi:6-phosphogluconolactonase (cycloisomerase 2 family)